MEDHAFVETLLRKKDEIIDSLWCFVGEELDFECSKASVDSGEISLGCINLHDRGRTPLQICTRRTANNKSKNRT